MPKTAKPIIVGSIEAFSGKSAAILGIAFQLQQLGFDIAYGKPIGTRPVSDVDTVDVDVEFVAKTLELGDTRIHHPLLYLDEPTVERQLSGGDFSQQLAQHVQSQGEDLLLIEGPGTLDEGALFNLSLSQIAESIDAPVLLVARFASVLVLDKLISAKRRLGDRLAGLLITDIPADQLDRAEALASPFLEQQSMPILALLPQAPLLRSISVKEIVGRLQAEVLCGADRLDLMVESLSIGAMNVNSALRYFRKGTNMAVVTGGDRTDIQLAALETSTHCLVLTGHIPPSPEIISRASDLEVPILSVDSDTLTTVETIDEMFGHVQLREPSKVAYIRDLMGNRLDMARLLAILDIRLPTTAGRG